IHAPTTRTPPKMPCCGRTSGSPAAEARRVWHLQSVTAAAVRLGERFGETYLTASGDTPLLDCGMMLSSPAAARPSLLTPAVSVVVLSRVGHRLQKADVSPHQFCQVLHSAFLAMRKKSQTVSYHGLAGRVSNVVNGATSPVEHEFALNPNAEQTVLP